MKMSLFSEEQIVGVLKEAETGVPVKKLCRRIGISDATCYHWKAKNGGLEVNEALRLRQLEDENGRLKRIVAQQALACWRGWSTGVWRRVQSRPLALFDRVWARTSRTPKGLLR